MGERGPAEVKVSRGEVALITGPFVQPDTAVFPRWRTSACPLEWKGECKHTREHLWQNVRSLFGGSGWRGVGVQQRGVRGRTWAECKDLCGSGVLLRVSPTRGTSVVLCALAGEAVHLCFTLFLCPVCGGSQMRCPVHSHWVPGRSWLGFRWQIFPVSPERPAQGICRHGYTSNA